MGVLKIRQIWDRTCEKEPVLVGIDYFDELDKMTIEERKAEEIKSKQYYMATVGVDLSNSIMEAYHIIYIRRMNFHRHQ